MLNAQTMDYLTLTLLIELGLLTALIGPMQYGANLVRTGRFQQALPILRAYYTASRLLPRWRGPMAGYVCACYVGMGEFALAQPFAEEAVRENERRGYAQHLAVARAYLGVILVKQGDFGEAGPLLDSTLTTSIPTRLRPTVELFAANGYINLDRLEDAEKLLDGILRAAKPGSDVHIVALSNLSLCRLYQGHTEEALALSRLAAVPKAPTSNIRFAVMTGLMVCLTEANLLDEAQGLAVQITPLLNSMDPFRRGTALRVLAELALAQGELERARDYAQRSSTLGINPNAHANTLLIQAEVFAARHNTHRALTLCRDILETRAVRFYKQRAIDLIARLDAPDTLANSPAQKYTTTEEAETLLNAESQDASNW